METTLELQPGTAIYEVRTTDPVWGERLAHMGFSPEAPDRFVRRLSAHGDVERAFARFTACLEEMVQQSARRRPVRWEQGLAEFLTRVSGSPLRWFLYGSGALAVRGIDVDPGDLDFSVDDPYLVASLLADLLVEPVTEMTGWVADFGGRAFHGCLLEWVSGVHPSALPHEQEASEPELVRWRGYDVPVAPLRLQLAVNRRRGLTDRVAKIEAYLGA